VGLFSVEVGTNFVLAGTALVVAVVSASRWSYGAVSRYFENLGVKKTFGARLASVEVAVQDIPAIKTAVESLVADSKTNGGASAKDQNNRIEKKLDSLLESK